MKRILLFSALTMGHCALPAQASGLVPVKPLPGYTCMMVNETPEQSMDFSNPVSFKRDPSDSSPNVAPAGMQVAVRNQGKEVNGYLETVDFAFRPRWIAAKFLAPYHAKADPTTTCTPAVMSNGRLGFKFGH